MNTSNIYHKDFWVMVLREQSPGGGIMAAAHFKEFLRVTMEKWANIVGFEGHYQVSNLGRVRSLDRMIRTIRGMKYCKGTILRPGKCKGYLFVALKRRGFQKLCQVHVLVARHFISKPRRRLEVNHKDFDTKNNRVSNLEWVTSKGNKLYSKRHRAKLFE